MTALSPEELNSLYEARVREGDLDGLVRLYEDEATFGGPSGLDRGVDAIRESLARMLAMKPGFTVRSRRLVTAGGLALMAGDWHFTGVTADGESIDSTGTSVEVARQQPDGTWRYVIDEPAFLG
ncbi:YybH family protein [Embleya sp. MST-111070]|uniref:YybH family protein n=1 Tax=Embleya sp. MST-111070 TaxID=3398231 RepID=UPI003F73CA29